MKSARAAKYVLAAILVLGACGVCVEEAWARGGHHHARFGVVMGPSWGSYYYSRPLYYYPPYAPIVVEPPPVYIEQTPPPVATAAPVEPTNYWYYCAATRAYYPYVSECPGGWIKVLPQAPAQ